MLRAALPKPLPADWRPSTNSEVALAAARCSCLLCAQVDYAWDEPMAAHRLRVMLDTDGTFRDVGAHEYNLDVIKVCLQLLVSVWECIRDVICGGAAYLQVGMDLASPGSSWATLQRTCMAA